MRLLKYIYVKNLHYCVRQDIYQTKNAYKRGKKHLEKV